MKKLNLKTCASSFVIRRLFWGTSMLSLCLMSACSDSDTTIADNGGEEVAPTLNSESTATIITDAEELAQRVINYRTPQGTRAETVDIEMPAQPTVPSDAVSLADVGMYPTSGGSYVVPAGTNPTINSIRIVDGDYYIAGTVKIGLGWNQVQSEANFYVLPGGELTLEGTISNYVHVYNYGTLHHQSGNNYLYISSTGSLYSNVDLDLSNTSIQVDGGVLYVDGSLKASANSIGSNGRMLVGCGSEFKSLKIYGTNSRLYVRGTLSCSEFLELTDEAKVIMTPGSSLDIATYFALWNDGVRVEPTDDEYVYIKAGQLISNQRDLTQKLQGTFALDIAQWTQNYENLESSDFELYGEVLMADQLADKGLTWPEGCEAVSQPATKTVTVLRQIAKVEPDSIHAHNISATCVALSGDKVYVSWHQRGAAFQGCVEVGQVTSAGCTLLQYLATEASAAKTNGGKDYNHIMIDGENNRLYTVGNENKGGFIGYNDLTEDGLIANNELRYRRLLGGDGNCIIRTDNYLQLATTYGYEIYDAATLRRVSRTKLDGKAKFITSDALRIVTLNFESSTTTESVYMDKDSLNIKQATGLLASFAAGDTLLNNRSVIASGIVIAPTDGKNVVKIDGSDVYVARGAAGLTRYPDGKTFTVDLSKKGYVIGYANGVDVDDQYVYVANGGAGVYVLDKETFEVVANYTNVGGKSANFVVVKDGLIYVAYGESGWEVLELATVQG